MEVLNLHVSTSAGVADGATEGIWNNIKTGLFKTTEEVCGTTWPHHWRRETWWWNEHVEKAIVPSGQLSRPGRLLNIESDWDPDNLLYQPPVEGPPIPITIDMVKKAISQMILIELGFNDTSTLVGHFVSSPREREKIDRRDSRRDEREGQGRKRNRNESEETEEIKTSPPYPYLLQG